MLHRESELEATNDQNTNNFYSRWKGPLVLMNFVTHLFRMLFYPMKDWVLQW